MPRNISLPVHIRVIQHFNNTAWFKKNESNLKGRIRLLLFMCNYNVYWFKIHVTEQSRTCRYVSQCYSDGRECNMGLQIRSLFLLRGLSCTYLWKSHCSDMLEDWKSCGGKNHLNSVSGVYGMFIFTMIAWILDESTYYMKYKMNIEKRTHIYIAYFEALSMGFFFSE